MSIANHGAERIDMSRRLNPSSCSVQLGAFWGRVHTGFPTYATKALFINHPSTGLIATKDTTLEIKRSLLFDIELCTTFVTIQAPLGRLLATGLTDDSWNLKVTLRALHGYPRILLGPRCQFLAFPEISRCLFCSFATLSVIF